MRLEAKRLRLTDVLRITGVVAMVYLAAFPFIYESTNCTTIGPNEKFVIAVPGSGVINGMPDEAEQKRLQEVVKVWRENPSLVKRIVLLDGIEREKASTAGYLRSIEPSISRDKIDDTDSFSIDTATNMDELALRVSTNEKVLIVTSASHVKRAVFFACAKGIKATGRAAAEVASMETKVKERLGLTFAMLFDPEGSVPTWLKKQANK